MRDERGICWLSAAVVISRKKERKKVFLGSLMKYKFPFLLMSFFLLNRNTYHLSEFFGYHGVFNGFIWTITTWKIFSHCHPADLNLPTLSKCFLVSRQFLLLLHYNAQQQRFSLIVMGDSQRMPCLHCYYPTSGGDKHTAGKKNTEIHHQFTKAAAPNSAVEQTRAKEETIETTVAHPISSYPKVMNGTSWLLKRKRIYIWWPGREWNKSTS